MNPLIDLILAGNAYFTLESKVSGTRYTYRVYEAKKAKARRVQVYYVNLLMGRNNEPDYRYIGFIKDGQFHHGGMNGRVTVEAPSFRGFRWFWEQLKMDNRVELEKVQVWPSGRCCRCGRKLTVPQSISIQMGSECAGRVMWDGVR